MKEQQAPESERINITRSVVRENRDRQVLLNYMASAAVERKLVFHRDAFVLEWPRLGS